ncbi:ATP-binding protein, partial [Enterococcus hirae]|uniref:ATP-binding protein n=1 Tax=Enterococcus hirae TaxID=1354 RepID=UPI001965862D
MVDDLRRDPAATVVADEAAVVVSELLGNAVRHADPLERGEVLLQWRVRSDEVEIEVVDGGGGPLGSSVASPREDPMATSGRGLHIINVLAERWGSSIDDAGCRS